MFENIPKHWNINPLFFPEISTIIMGQSPSSNTYNNNQEGLPFFQGKADFGDFSPTPRVWCSKPLKISQKDDILLSVRAPVGAVNYNTETCCIGRGLAAIRAGEKLLPKYIYYFFKYYEPILKEEGSGAVFSAITKSFVENIRIPVPPTLAEQQEIVDVLDATSEIIRLRTACIESAQSLIPTLFQEMFGDMSKNINNYELFKIKNLGKVTTGSTPSSKKENMFGGTIPFITPADLESGQDEYGRYVTQEGAQNSRIVRAGSSLVCCIGATIGKVDKAIVDSCFNQQINAIEWNEGINDIFGLYLFRQIAPLIRNKASHTTLPILNKGNFENIIIPKPPKPKQDLFAEKAQEIEAYIKSQQAELDNAKAMFQSLLHHSFTGELTRHKFGGDANG